jgi:deoxyribonuclease V
MSAWPESAPALRREQERIAALRPPAWRPGPQPMVGGCFVCFPRGESGPGRRGDPAWAGAVAMASARVTADAVVAGAAGAPYQAGLLGLREGPLLEAAVRALDPAPDVLLVDATGRDHPRGAGLALHLGAMLELPTIGVTHRPLLAAGAWPEPLEPGAESPLLLGGLPVALWLCTRRGARPLAVHPGWRVDLPTAREIVLGAARRARTPEPLRRARRLAPRARAGRL